MNIEFHSEAVYGDNDKYIKTKIKYIEINKCKFSGQKNTKRKYII